MESIKIFTILWFIVLFMFILFVNGIYSQASPWSNNIRELDISSLKTGDLIFFCGKTFGEKVFRYLGGFTFTHVGIIVESYIFELDLGQGYKEGVRLIPIRDKIERYKGYDVVAVKRCEKQISEDSILELIPKYMNFEFDYMMTSYVFGDDGKRILCSNFIARLLHELGLLSLGKKYSSYSPEDLLNLKEYSEPEYYLICSK